MHRIVAPIILALYMGLSGGQTLRQLRFSPDGRYVLAQDDSRITVLTLQPFAVLFQAPGEKADTAQFTPDSRQVVFITSASSPCLNPPVFDWRQNQTFTF
jgi:hypothetical protein